MANMSHQTEVNSGDDVHMMMVFENESNETYCDESDIASHIKSENISSLDPGLKDVNEIAEMESDYSETTENVFQKEVEHLETNSEKGQSSPEKIKRSNVKRERPFKCDLCGRIFTYYCSLKRHNLVHTKEKPHSCDTCGREFSRQESLMRHNLTHTGERPHKCEICGKKFTCAHILKRHLLIHTGDKPYECHICGQQFTLSYHVTRHLLKHTGEKPYICRLCGKEFTQQGDHKRHMLLHSEEMQQDDLKRQEDNRFICNICGKGFPHAKQLEIHQEIHDPNTLTCKICGRNFKSLRSKKMHMNAHIRNSHPSSDGQNVQLYSRHKKLTKQINEFKKMAFSEIEMEEKVERTFSPTEDGDNGDGDKGEEVDSKNDAAPTPGNESSYPDNNTEGFGTTGELARKSGKDFTNSKPDHENTTDMDKEYSVEEILEGNVLQDIVKKSFHDNDPPDHSLGLKVDTEKQVNDCGICGESFTSVVNLEQHMSSTHHDVHHMSSSHHDVHHMSSTDRDVQHMSSTDRDVQHMSSTDRDVQHMSSTHHDVQHMSSTDRDVQHMSSTHHEVQSEDEGENASDTDDYNDNCSDDNQQYQYVL